MLDAERAHYMAMGFLKTACRVPLLRRQLARFFMPQASPVSAFGLMFRNAVGLGAGFDKNAVWLRELDTLGFGFVEVGTVTPRPQPGNPQPRLFRLPQDEALLNRMGFNNDGADVIAARLKQWREAQEAKVKDKKNNGPQQKTASLLIGGNIGKNKDTPNASAWQDYETCFSKLRPFVDFFVVNVSSPNTPGLRALQERDALHNILTRLQLLNKSQLFQKPILLKIAPDLSLPQLDDVIALAQEINLDGLVISNTTISRENLQTGAAKRAAMGAGGLSGKPVRHASTEMINYVWEKTGGTLSIIGSGGVFTAAHAAEKRAAGAALIEVWTGFIYEGPQIVKNICNGLNL